MLLKTQNMMNIKEVLLRWFKTFFIKKLLLLVSKMRILCSSIIDNIRGADLADMQLISKFNKVFRFFIMCY